MIANEFTIVQYATVRSVSDGNRKQHFRDSRFFTFFHKGINNNLVHNSLNLYD